MPAALSLLVARQGLRLSCSTTVAARPSVHLLYLRRAPSNSPCLSRGIGRAYSTAPPTPQPPTSPTKGEEADKEVAKPEEKGKSILARLWPSSMKTGPETGSSFRKIVLLATPERKPLTIAVGLLLLSSAVTMSVPMTIGACAASLSSRAFRLLSVRQANSSTTSRVLIL